MTVTVEYDTFTDAADALGHENEVTALPSNVVLAINRVMDGSAVTSVDMDSFFINSLSMASGKEVIELLVDYGVIDHKEEDMDVIETIADNRDELDYAVESERGTYLGFDGQKTLWYLE